MTIINDIKSLFTNQDFLVEALTHRSWINEHKSIAVTNERLEFLGDAVLELFVSKFLFDRYPDKPEGFMTVIRSNLVNTDHLALCAKRIGLSTAILLSKGEEETGGRDNPSLLADCMEAVIGAIYIDLGAEKCSAFISDNVLFDLEEIRKNPLKDAKSRFQEKVQAKNLPAPIYKIVSQVGPDHSKTFTVGVYVNNQLVITGVGRSKAEAEQNSASKALEVW